MIQSSLFLSRLVIVTNEGKTAYDEKFHRGVNIISGHNSSGKSTITHCIFFVLGGAYNDFVPEVRSCQHVTAEIEVNHIPLTIRRYIEVSEEGKISKETPMYIYFGPISDVATKDVQWQRYGYRISTERKSFSNVLFELLGFPEIHADSNITMHQVLRLMYLDQESPTNSLFYFEPFDRDITRETTADLLMGLYDAHLSDAKLELERLEKELASKKGEEKVMKEMLSASNATSSLYFNNVIERLTTEIEGINTKVLALREKENQETKKVTPEYEHIKQTIESLRHKKNTLADEISRLKADIQDSEYFIKTLERKITSLRNSIETRNYLESLTIEYCPECLTKLDTNVPEGHCRLCKSPIENGQRSTQANRIKLELTFQLAESKKLLALDKNTLMNNESLMQTVVVELENSQRRLDSAISNIRSSREEEIDQLIQEKGFNEGEILQYRTLLETAIRYENLLKEIDSITSAMSKKHNFIQATERAIFSKREKMRKAIAENGVFLLTHDQDRQLEFRNPGTFVIDFRQNTAYITDKYYKFSASSAFYLKMAARFSILLSSIQNENMFYPRFMFADNMEDKGMEESRAQNFQRVVVDKLESLDNQDYQLIYATSFIPEELDNEKYVIGEKYTENNKSLKNIVYPT